MILHHLPAHSRYSHLRCWAKSSPGRELNGPSICIEHRIEVEIVVETAFKGFMDWSTLIDNPCSQFRDLGWCFWLYSRPSLLQRQWWKRCFTFSQIMSSSHLDSILILAKPLEIKSIFRVAVWTPSQPGISHAGMGSEGGRSSRPKISWYVDI